MHIPGTLLYENRKDLIAVYPELTPHVEKVVEAIALKKCKGCSATKYTYPLVQALMDIEYDGRDLSPLVPTLGQHIVDFLKDNSGQHKVRRQAAQIASEIRQRKAKMTFAVFHLEDAKLQQLMAGGNLEEFLAGLTDEDPYTVREIPPISGIKQYVLMDRNNKLPFMESGVTKKQGDDIIRKEEIRAQLEAHVKQFPMDEPSIREALAKLDAAETSCEEKSVAESLNYDQISRMEPPIREKTVSVDEEQWGSREPCPMCTLKHLGQAIVLLNESLTGYPLHRWIAVGHLAEAEAEAPTHDMANRIRAHRLQAMDDLDYIPRLTDILAELDAIVRV